MVEEESKEITKGIKDFLKSFKSRDIKPLHLEKIETFPLLHGSNKTASALGLNPNHFIDTFNINQLRRYSCLWLRPN